MVDIEEQRRKMIAAEKILCSFKEAINELGFDFGCTEVKVLAAESEKREREIDDWQFARWHTGTQSLRVYDGQDCLLSMIRVSEAQCKLIAAAPDAMRALIDYVNYYDGEPMSEDFAKQIDRFTKIIDDAGFGSDIQGGKHGNTNRNSS